ncbi:MAG: hypothetical protein A2007_06290 [Verrucomicrobia bacterium GWC2_42_7]|nr:MAG: hypothetical protein A2007_06290 [Verrucomicrobia bacterium GWC2_42_7]
MKDYYEILNIPSDASPIQVRAAFRKKALNVHPDKLGKADYEHFLDVKEAYDILNCSEKRRHYDRAYEIYQEDLAYLKGKKKETKVETINGWENQKEKKEVRSKTFSFHQPNIRIINTLRRRIFDAALTDSTGPETDLDLVATLDVSLEKTLVTSLYPLDISEEFDHHVESGRYFIKTPPGLFQGAHLLVPGLGLTCPHSDSVGNLLIEISLLSHNIFKVVGNDIYSEIPVMPWEIVLSMNKKIPSLDAPGHENISLNPDFLPKTLLRFEQKGLYNSSNKRGDMLVTLKLQIPQPPTEYAKTLWLQLSQEYGRVV